MNTIMLNPGDKPYWPLLGEDGRYVPLIREIIVRHLAVCSIRARKAMESEEALGFADGTNRPFAGRYTYWANVFAAAKLFAYQVSGKQEELLALNAEEIQKVRDEWNRQTGI